MNHFHLPRRILCLILLLCCLAPSLPRAQALTIPTFEAARVLLADPESGQIFYQSNIHEARYPASTTKIMTALVALEHSELNEMVTISQWAYSCNGYTGSSSGLRVGEQISMENLLYCLMLPSGNEAAYAIAEHISGNEADFLQLMNDKATALGCENTVFYNPCGLPDENLTTAWDLFLITQEAMKNETFATIVQTAQRKLPATNMQGERTILTTNRMILRRSDPTYYAPCFGVKTGHTDGAGYCLVSLATLEGTSLIAVMLGCETDPVTGYAKTFQQSKDLFEWGFENFSYKTLIEDKLAIREIPVSLSAEKDSVVVQTSAAIGGIVPNDLDISTLEPVIDVPQQLRAPIAAGDKVGTLSISYGGFDYGTVDLIAMQDVSLSKVLYYVDMLDNFFSSLVFRIILAVVGGLLVLYLIVLIVLGQRKRRRNRRRYPNKRSSSPSRYRGGRRRRK